MIKPSAPEAFPTSLEEMDSLLQSFTKTSDHILAFDASNFRASESKLLVESSTIQFLATWARSLCGRLQLEQEPNENPVDALRRISDTVPGAVVGMFDEQAWVDMPKGALAKFKEAFFKQQRSWPDLSVRDQAVLLCQDNIPAAVGLPPQLYPISKKGEVGGREQFSRLLEQLMEAVTSEANILGSILTRREQLTTILHELFKNTHDHARKTVDKQPLSFSIRGPYARFYSPKQLAYTAPPIQKNEQGQEIVPKFNQAEHFASFFVRARHSQTQRGQTEVRRFLGLLELSVFDTGPGFAATYLKDGFDNSTAQEQFEAVLGCFATGRSATGDESRGYGLWKVLRDLRDLKGFIRVRTNKVHVYRDFAWYENMFMQDGDIVAPKERLMDWQRGITKKVTEEYPDMQGAHVAILIPLGENL